MSIEDVLPQTTVGQDIARRSREEGREGARVATMSLLLKRCYGPLDDLTELAHKLVATDYEQHLESVVLRVPLEQLRSVECSSIRRQACQSM
ncbi:hypothetical protein [Paractinoplanes durhamensis]|uniref:Uncharacterized protein n=1 Tax=Paractinoplanes durhamensis TaxID=113563 RepID=A0ABQ3ZBU0_9ACTN|nr:hypothetical protein [Actinoplanes durhamensis]GIE07313.1 hypothetical protein Adu01nite_86630 [Actinoplanes durhamensis]